MTASEELGLWQKWVLLITCDQLKMPPITGHEWDALMRSWHPGKMPLDSVNELTTMREQTP